MNLRFWGVRGSIAVPGPDTSRYGGNTSCVEVSAPGMPSVVFDCGTGARALGRDLFNRPERELHLLFSHFHMDHVFGFPFFGPIFAPSFSMTVSAPAFHPDGARDRISRYLNGVFHPVRLTELPGRIEFDAIRPGRPFVRGPYEIVGFALNHPGGACAYRVRHGGRSVAYVTDTAPLSRPGEGLAGGGDPNGRELQFIEFLRDTDVVVFDTMFTVQEYLEKMTWGHCYPEYAAAVCAAAGVRELFLFHHSPDATDADLDALAEVWTTYGPVRVRVAREGLVVNLEG
ncbi:MAG: MBL fold metallo-hydrolase [Myxococcota bacterium]